MTFLRSFSTACPSRKAAAERFQNSIPPYPYGPSLQYKQSDSGLYGGSSIQFGNIISPKNAIKNRRTWHPNIHRKRLWSDALQRFISVKVQARVLRTIDKVGGLDEYLLGDKPARIKELGMEGWRLRWKVMQTPKVQERLREERKRLRLPSKGWREPVKVEEEVERVKGVIVEEIAADGRDPSMGEEEPENEFSDETLRTVRSRMAEDPERPITYSDVEEAAVKEALSKKMKIPHLVALRSEVEEQREGDEERVAQSTARGESPDVVQANDRRTLTGKAFDKLRGLLGR